MDLMNKVTEPFKKSWKFAAASTGIVLGLSWAYGKFIPAGSANVGPVEFLYSTAVQVPIRDAVTNPPIADPTAVMKVLSVFGGGVQAGIPEWIIAGVSTFLTIMAAIVFWNLIGAKMLNTVFKRVFAVYFIASVIATAVVALIATGNVASGFSMGLLVAWVITGFLTALLMTFVIEKKLLGLGIMAPALRD